ncbi:DUF4439 domain-containing protein [Brachybacterium phenoliresistens]|uniref:DUF4439 domain-containing protein n=1 Tax=Brachybacterium phenoliresistens TaxID=396014 RepID=Z9JTS8_9MICO|nr:DUF4439 domain-containing protein [Brachybacterium phenoliresistens]EWS81201.1 hypothetical protein BF93_18715 [Brachybacterium phenoliresistens]
MTRAARRSRPHPSSPVTARRSLLLAAGVGSLGLATGCARLPVRLGQPDAYTPPPPGIDDLYRVDLLDALAQAIALAGSASDVRAAQAELPDLLVGALQEQRGALLTGAEAEDETSAAASGGAESPTVAAPTAMASDGGGATVDAVALVASLVALRDLCVQAARQVSGSLSRPVTAIGAWTAWATARLVALLPQAASALTPLPAPEDVVPTREVPETDPPSVGAQVDFHGTLETAQTDEWYVGYVYEVLAARSGGSTREAHLAARDLHRSRAEQLAAIAVEAGAPVPVRQAVYPLPSSFGSAAGIDAWPSQASHDLLTTYLALVGAAPFAQRPLPIVVALTEAAALAPHVGRLEALPSFDED